MNKNNSLIPNFYLGILTILTILIGSTLITFGAQLKPYLIYNEWTAPNDKQMQKVAKYSYAIFQSETTAKYFTLNISNLEYEQLISDSLKNTKLTGYQFIGAVQSDVQ